MTKETFIFDIFCEQISFSTRELLNKEDVPQKARELLQKVQTLTEGVKDIRVEATYSSTGNFVHKEEYKFDEEFTAPLKVARPILFFPEGRTIKKSAVLKFFTPFGVAELQKYQYLIQDQLMPVGDTTIILVCEDDAARCYDEYGVRVLKKKPLNYRAYMFSPSTAPKIIIQATHGWDEVREISHEEYRILQGDHGK